MNDAIFCWKKEEICQKKKKNFKKCVKFEISRKIMEFSSVSQCVLNSELFFLFRFFWVRKEIRCVESDLWDYYCIPFYCECTRFEFI